MEAPRTRNSWGAPTDSLRGAPRSTTSLASVRVAVVLITPFPRRSSFHVLAEGGQLATAARRSTNSGHPDSGCPDGELRRGDPVDRIDASRSEADGFDQLSAANDRPKVITQQSVAARRRLEHQERTPVEVHPFEVGRIDRGFAQHTAGASVEPQDRGETCVIES